MVGEWVMLFREHGTRDKIDVMVECRQPFCKLRRHLSVLRKLGSVTTMQPHNPLLCLHPPERNKDMGSGASTATNGTAAESIGRGGLNTLVCLHSTGCAENRCLRNACINMKKYEKWKKK